MYYLAQSGATQAPGRGASLLQKLKWAILDSPAAQFSGMANPIAMASVGGRLAAGGSVVGRMLAKDVASGVERGSPGLVKWLMTKAGKVVFAPAHEYHDAMAGSVGGFKNVRAGGVIDEGKVKIYRDLAARSGARGANLAAASEESANPIRQAVAIAFRESGGRWPGEP